MRIAIPIYPHFAATDAVGPYEVLSRLPGVTLAWVSSTPGLVATDTGFLQIHAEPLAAMPDPDLVMVPGAPTAKLPLGDAALIEWLIRADRHAQWTTSVCSGAYLLGEAGLLAGKRATTHWSDLDGLARYGATAVRDVRYVFDGKLVTGAGVSAGFDFALALAARIAGDDYAQAIQLALEYDPKPPFDAGSPAKAPAHLVEIIRRYGLAAGRARAEPAAA